MDILVDIAYDEKNSHVSVQKFSPFCRLAFFCSLVPFGENGLNGLTVLLHVVEERKLGLENAKMVKPVAQVVLD